MGKASGGRLLKYARRPGGAGPGCSLGPDWARSGGGLILYGVSVLRTVPGLYIVLPTLRQ